jgi:spore germination cell wall hydrolase CwlJ-like protein
MTELLVWLTLTVYYESRGEPEKCQRYVADVVMNRSPDMDVRKTVLAPYQFSWVPEKMENGVLKPQFRPNRESEHWKRAEKVAKESIYSTKRFNATHFHATYIPKPASWSNLRLIATCGLHHFYV